MNFFTHEVKNLRAAFPAAKSTLENDFQDFELAAINNLGVLRNQAHMYLDTKIRFFPNDPNPKAPDVPAAHSAYITIYYGNGDNLDKIVQKIIDALEPNYRILIGKNWYTTCIPSL